MTDKLNDFQLILTDGSDPLLPNGNNIAFCYGDMQWTTGSASQCVGGFGGDIFSSSASTMGSTPAGAGGDPLLPWSWPCSTLVAADLFLAP
jgi:hypothetical protein